MLSTTYMQKLSDKLKSELTEPTLVMSHVFKLPNTKPFKENQNTYFYTIG